MRGKVKSYKVKVKNLSRHCEESRYYRDDVAISKSVKKTNRKGDGSIY